MTRHRTLYRWFAESARRVPDAPALEVGHECLTYAQLTDLADRIAARLVATVGPASRVGLLASRTPTAFAGYLAALRAGATVVPLNPSFPAQRNQEIVGAAGVVAVLVDEPCDDTVLGAARPTVVRMGPADVHATMHGPRATPPAVAPASPDDIAYLLFTSGSTGLPKGVPIAHRNIDPFLRHNIQRYRVGPGCRLSQTFELTFDGSVLDMFLAWGSGATLVVPGRQEIMAPVEFIVDRRLTHWCSVPSVVALARSMGDLAAASMPDLRWSMFSAEQLSLDHAAAWARAAPGSVVENIYGPTEAGITVSAYRLPPKRTRWPTTSNGTVPIGRVYPHLEWLIVDSHGDPATTGELCVRGSQLFQGYLDPSHNAGRFMRLAGGRAETVAVDAVGAADWYRTGDVVTLESAELVHLSRRDRQAKVRGHRVELTEVESALRDQPGVTEAVVVAVSGTGGLTTLVAVLRGRPAPPAIVATALRRRLPAYMIPERFEWVDRLPVNPNGKVDYRGIERDYRCRRPDTEEPQ